MNTLIRDPRRPLSAVPIAARLSFLLLLAVVLLFCQTINFEFLNYDDPLHVSENPLITQFAAAKLPSIWGDSLSGLYIPLTYTLWGILALLSKWLHPFWNPALLDPAVFHSANIILHAGSVLVVFSIFRLLLKNDRAAAGGAMFFALHPLQVETVAWVSEMKGGLAGFLGLTAIWQYLRYALTEPAVAKSRRRLYLAALGLFIASILAKPSAVCVTLMAAVLAIILIKRDWRLVIRELSPWLLLAIPLIFITKEVQPSEGLDFLPNLWQRILVAGDASTFYWEKILWPFSLGPDYGKSPQNVLASDWVYVTGLMPYLAVPVLLNKICRPWLLAVVMIFTAALLPVLGFIPFSFQAISTVANRYVYLAMLAPALLFGHLLCLWPNRRVVVVATILLLLLASRSVDYLRYWHDSLAFNLQALSINPQSNLALNNLGITYKQLGRIAEATAAYKQAIANAPDKSDAYANLGVLYAETGKPEEAKDCYLQALNRHPPYPAKIYLTLGVLAAGNNRPAEALDYYHKALTLEPGLAQAYGYLGILYTQLEQFDEAIANYRKAIEFDPYLAAAHLNIGVLYELKHHKSEAIRAYRQAISLNPDSPDGYNNLGRLLVDDNRSEEALPLLQKAVALAPSQANPANNLGLAYLKLGQPHEAAVWFRQALAIDPLLAEAGENLASATNIGKKSPEYDEPQATQKEFSNSDKTWTTPDLNIKK